MRLAMAKGGQLTVTLEKADGPEPGGTDTAWSRASPTRGPGYAPESSRGSSTSPITTKGDRGSGLGLSVSREIVEAQGGRIWVKTELGKGTEFAVWLPA